MVFGPIGMVSEAARLQRCKVRARSFLASQNGAVTIDFIPLVCAVIGLGFGAMAIATSVMDASSGQMSSRMEKIEIRTYLPNQSETQAATGSAALKRKDAEFAKGSRLNEGDGSLVPVSAPVSGGNAAPRF